MILSALFQGKLFVLFFVLGIVSAFIYDFIRLFRFYKKHGKILISAEDLIYWLFVSAVFFYFVLYTNNGELRFFIFAAFFTGHIIYFYIFSRCILSVQKQVINILLYIIKLLIAIISTPFRLIYAVFKRPVKFLCKLLYKLLISLEKCVKIWLYKSNFLRLKRNDFKKCQKTKKIKKKNLF